MIKVEILFILDFEVMLIFWVFLSSGIICLIVGYWKERFELFDWLWFENRIEMKMDVKVNSFGLILIGFVIKRVSFVDLVGFKFEFVKIIILCSSEENLIVLGVWKNNCDVNGNVIRR